MLPGLVEMDLVEIERRGIPAQLFTFLAKRLDATVSEVLRMTGASRWLGEWIRKPQPALGGRKPEELLDTPTGLDAVMHVLGAIQSGVSVRSAGASGRKPSPTAPTISAAKGAAHHPGRSNDKGGPLVHATETGSMSVLETAAHVDASGFPLNRFLVEIRIPDDLCAAREVTDAAHLDQVWSAIPAGMASVRYGSAWLLSKRSLLLLLLLPSAIVPEEHMMLIHPMHPDTARLAATAVRRFEYRALLRR